jgi:hypothetical protein
MTVSRRDFLKWLGSHAAGALLLPPLLSLSGQTSTKVQVYFPSQVNHFTNLDQLLKDMYAPLIKDFFNQRNHLLQTFGTRALGMKTLYLHHHPSP